MKLFKIKKNLSIFFSIFILILFCLIILFSFLDIVTASNNNIWSDSSAFYYYKDNQENTIDITNFTPVSSNFSTVNLSSLMPINVTNIRKIPKGSVLIKLPDNRTGIKLLNGTASILPLGSVISMIKHNDGSDKVSNWPTMVVQLNNQSALVGSPKVVQLPIKNFTKKETYTQSIDSLNSYQITMRQPWIKKSDMQNTILSYTISWGDGTINTYNSTQQSITHVYSLSGTYLQTFNITDCFGTNYTLKQNYTVYYEGHLMHGYLVLKEYKEPIAATTSVAMGLSFIGFIALTETGKYKFLALLPLLIPMYTRIQKEDVLDQFVRGQIYGFIRSNPGVHYNQIRREMDIKNGTLSYHLRVLEKTELIKSRREGMRYRVFYPTGVKFPKEERFRLTELQVDILNVIREHRGIHQKQIAKKLNKKPQTINYNIKVLEQADLIEIRKKGRKTLCYPNEARDNNVITTK